MTKLSTLRSQLAGLRGARASLRWGTALASALTVALWGLGIFLVLDLIFERSLEIPSRALLVVLLVAGIGWASWKLTRSLFGKRETVEDMALMVERQQKIDSDLVAALQFETPAAAKWGSADLKDAVINYVADVGKGINVFEGFSREDLQKRGLLLAGTAGVAILLAALFPGHAGAFFNRLLLGGRHYPTRTVISQVLLNEREVLRQDKQGSAPDSSKCAQGRPVTFLIQATGELPPQATVQLTGISGARSKSLLDLKALTLDARLMRLKQGEEKLRDASANLETDLSQTWREELLSLIAADSPAAAERLSAQTAHADLPAVADSVAQAISAWPATASKQALFAGELPRLLDGVKYKLLVGDAWTDSAQITMIPLPVVELQLVPTPPAYASGGKQVVVESSSRQLSVLEGTDVKLAIECKNHKRLKSAWMTLRTKETSRRLELKSVASSSDLRWELAEAEANPFAKVKEELRYEIQVEDEDGLSLESPVRGMIRIRTDKDAVASLDLVTHVVLPSAKPVLEYRVSDDFGISQIRLRVEIERQAPADGTPAKKPIDQSADGNSGTDVAGAPSQAVPTETVLLDLLPKGQSLKGDKLPLQAKYSLRLDSLRIAENQPLPQLVKGDRLKLTLEATDYRGDQPGTIAKSEPQVLDISDESGVLASISEADESSEKRLSDIIKRQLGIGESP